MKIKRLFPLFVIFSLTSCEDLPPQDEQPVDEEEYTYQNGTYVATYDKYDYNHGKAVLKFTLTGDVIKDVDFDYLDKSGNQFSMGADLPSMTIDPNTFLPNVENAIANATIVPVFNEIDIIAQAEKETEDANELTKAILSAAKDGSTDTVFIEQTYLSAFNNGTYVATYDQFDYYDGKAILKFTLTNDEIKDIDFDYINQSGERLSQGAELPCITIDPNTFLPNVENAIANASIVPTLNEIDVLAQAEKETADANELTKAILSAAKDGSNDTVFIEQTYTVSFRNGTYLAKFEGPDSHGWTGFLQLDLNNDVISNVDFDYMGGDGVSRKSEDQDYNDIMYDILGITKPEWYVVEIESKIANVAIIAKTPICVEYASEIDAVTGATSSSSDANHLLEQILISAIKGITETLVVPHPEEK